MVIRYVSDIQKYTTKLKFPIFLYISNKKFTVETEKKLIAIIIRLYQQSFPIETLRYFEIEDVEFEEIETSLIKV